MKKNYLKLFSSFLISLIIITGCQKVIQDQPFNSDIESLSKSDHDGDKNECRLVFATNTDITASADFTFHYNNKGLADTWDIANYGFFTQEYNLDGKLKKSTETINGEVIFSIRFFYKGDKLEKTINYDASGTIVTDVAYYKYNAQGKMVKVQSFMNDYFATAKYTPEGNISASELFFSGVPVYGVFYTYKQHYKNPFLAVPGIDNAFPFYTPADFFSSKWQYASSKQVGYDENGDPIVFFEYDPSKTIWQAGPHNYPYTATYFDLLSAGWFPYKYEFENCGGSIGNDDHNSQMAAPPSNVIAKKINPLMLLKRNPSKSIKEQVREFRQQLKSIKN